MEKKEAACIFSRNADLFREVSRRQDFFHKNPSTHRNADDPFFLGKSLVAYDSNDPMWELMHRIMLPGFTTQAIRLYYQRMVDVVRDEITRLKLCDEKMPLNASEWLFRLATEITVHALLNSRLYCQKKDDPFIKAKTLIIADREARLKETESPFSAEERQEAASFMHQIAMSILESGKKRIAENKEPQDLLERMLIQDDPVAGQRIPEEQIISEVKQILLIRTTGVILAYAFYYVITIPQVYEQLMEEIDGVLGNRSYPVWEDLSQLFYTHNIFQETLRLHPMPYLMRETVQDTTIGQVPCKHAVNKGDNILLSLPLLHQNSDYWQNPKTFDPERFSSANKESIHPGSYQPFGIGSRICLGAQFAIKQGVLVLATFYRHFHFDLQDKNYVLEINGNILNPPKNLFLLKKNRSTRRKI